MKLWNRPIEGATKLDYIIRQTVGWKSLNQRGGYGVPLEMK